MFSYQVLLWYQQVAFINLILQIVMLGMILIAVWFRLKASFRRHGTLMLSAVILHVISFLLVMGPSFLSFGSSVISQPSNRRSAITLAHTITGGISIVLGVWLVGSWHLQSITQICMKRKPIMRITITLWITALLLGILLYMLLYTTLL